MKSLFRVWIVFIATLVISSQFMGVSKALSPEQQKLFNKGIFYYNHDPCADLTTSNDKSDGDTIQPGPIYIMGDSITVIAKDSYRNKFGGKWRPTVEGLSSRQMTETPPSPNGLGQIEKDKEKIKNANAIVIALGTNGSGNSTESIKSSTRKIINKIKDYKQQPVIFWVNIIDTRNDADSKKTNKAIEEAVGNSGTMIDWYSEAKAKADLDSFNEGVHPTKEKDIQLLVDLVYSAVTESTGSQSSLDSASGSDPGNITYKAVGNIPKEGKTVKASIFGGTYKGGQFVPTNKDQDPQSKNGATDDNGIGYAGNGPTGGHVAFAELDNDTALGHLPNHTKLEITYKGKKVIAEKRDIGAGGPEHPLIDLWWETAKLLDFKDGIDEVKVRGVVSSTQLTKVDGSATADSGEAEAKPANDDCSCGGSGGGSDTTLSGSNNEQKALNFFVSKGFSPEQAAGIIGNFIQESNVNPRSVEGGSESDSVPPPVGPDGQPGYGIAQWTSPGRKENLKKFASQKGQKVSSLKLQLEFVMEEMKSYGGLEQDLKKINGDRNEVVTQSAFLFHRVYEVSGDGIEGIRERAQSGIDILTRFGSGASGGTVSPDASAASSGCASSSDKEGGDSGEASGDYSLPVAKRFYTQNKYWFTKPHHDYPAADIPVTDGTPVYSMTAGRVVAAPAGGGCGNGVIIQSTDGIEYTYCHGSDGGTISGAKAGDTVKPGKLIMHSDNTGHTDGPHVHVQIKVSGTLHCPQNLFVAIAENKPIPKESSLPASGCTN